MQSMGVIGLGAFGQLLVQQLRQYFNITAFDTAPEAKEIADHLGIKFDNLPVCASARHVVLAVPVLQIGPVAKAMAPFVQPGATVFDVASVKIGPAQAMVAALPGYVHIIGTHPLFGPQSAKTGIKGLKIAICPVRNAGIKRVGRVQEFLRTRLQLDAFISDPQSHDRDMAVVQGLTHLIAKVLDEMEPLPRRQTTLSFDYLLNAMELVRGDSDELFRAIERENPYSAQVRKKFFALTEALRAELETAKSEK